MTANPPAAPQVDPQIVVDAHEDIAYNTLNFGRDFTQGAYAKRRLEVGTHTPQINGSATTGLPDALLGRVAIIFGTIFVAPVSSKTVMGDFGEIAYETPAEAYRYAVDQIDIYQRLADENDRIALVRTQSELSAVLATWAEGTPFDAHKVGIVLSMEGADPIREPQAFDEWYERGVRAVGLAWSETRYSGGTGRPGPLTAMGRELLEIMGSYNAILDLSHLSEEAYLEAVDRYGGRIIASHSNPRRFRGTDRHLSDDMIRRLAERDGVIGAVPYNSFLQDGWTRTDRKSKTPLATFIAVIDHICQITGSARHVGIGSDFDGGFGAEHIPEGLDTVSDLYRIKPLLAARGYAPEDVTAILGGNFLRILRATLPA
jgi:membrane dipeptidase